MLLSSYDENTQRAIQEYQKWYDKAIKCKDAVTDLRLEQRKLAKEKLGLSSAKTAATTH